MENSCDEFADHKEFAAMHTGFTTANHWSGLPCFATHEFNGESWTAFVEWVALLCDARVQWRVFDRLRGLKMFLFPELSWSHGFFDVCDTDILGALDGHQLFVVEGSGVHSQGRGREGRRREKRREQRREQRRAKSVIIYKKRM